MLGLIQMLLRFVLLGVFVLGVKQAVELAQGGAEMLIDRLESGDDGPVETTLTHLHAALHRRQARDAGGADPFGEM